MFQNLKKIVLTGSSGFLGRHFVDYTLEKSDAQIICLVRDSKKISLKQNARLHYLDVHSFMNQSLNAQDSKILENTQAIVHLAARAHVMREESTDPEKEYFKANTELTSKILNASYFYHIPHFIFLSSIKVMGEENDISTGRGFRSSDSASPEDFYGKSKLEAEKLIQDFCKNRSNIRFSIIRPPLIYGPEVKANFLSLMKIVKSEIPLPFKEIRNQRSFIFSKNLCDLILYRIAEDNKNSLTLLPSDGKVLSLTECLNLIAQGFGKNRARLFYVPSTLLKFMLRISGKKHLYQRLCGDLFVDQEELAKQLNWKAPFSQKDAFQITCNWYQNNS